MFGGYDLESLVSDHPRALEFAKQHSTYNTYTQISFWSGVGIYVGLSLVSLATLDVKYFYGGAGGFLGGVILAGYFQSESRHYLYQAVNTYNGVNIPSQSEAKGLKLELLSFCF